MWMETGPCLSQSQHLSMAALMKGGSQRIASQQGAHFSHIQKHTQKTTHRL